MTKIATILPYKENYTYSKAGAAALWVRDFFKLECLKKSYTHNEAAAAFVLE